MPTTHGLIAFAYHLTLNLVKSFLIRKEIGISVDQESLEYVINLNRSHMRNRKKHTSVGNQHLPAGPNLDHD